MFSKLAYFLVFIFLVSCQDLQPAKKPKKLLTQTQMENILTDMILLDAMISVNNFRIDNVNIDVPNFVYNKYEIDSITLTKNIEYYNEDYEVNSEIYSNVKTNIEKLKQRLEYDKKLQDSLERVKLEAKRLDNKQVKKKK